MSKAWGLVAVVLIAGCGNKKESNKTPIVHEEEMPPPVQPAPPVAAPEEPSIDDQLMNGTAPAPPVNPECVSESTVVSFDPAKLRACFDSNGDGQGDQCVTWRRDGRVKSIDSEFAVEDADAKEPPEPPIEFRSDSENNDNERISVDGSSVEICPYDRACMKIMPRLDNGSIETVFTDPDYKRGAFVVAEEDGNHGAFEIWDLVAGRMRTRAEMKRVLADQMYNFSAQMGSGVVIGLANDDSTGRAFGTIFGLDGGLRGELAQGSRNLDVDKTFRHAGVYGITDVGPDDGDDEKPYVVYLHSLSTGGSLGKFTIKRSPDGSDDLSFHPLKNNFVAITQFGEQVRIDMIDLRTRTNRVLFAPGC